MATKKDPRLVRAGVSGHNDYCVYFHKKQNTNEIFYVGKGRKWRWNQKKNRNKHWHSIVSKYGFEVLIVASNLNNEKACLLEKFLINEIGVNNLCNYTLGGEGSEGYKHTEETLQKFKGKVFTTENKEKFSKEKLKNPTNYWVGKQRDEKTKIKISLSLSNKNRKKAEEMLLQNTDRKIISKELNLTLDYIRGLASNLRKNYEIEKLIN